MKNQFLISDSEKSRILSLHESLKNSHGTSLLNEVKKIGPYKVGGKKGGSEEYNNVYIKLFIRDSGSGEAYVEVSENGKTFKEVYDKVSKDFISKINSIKNDQQHQMYKKKYPSASIESIKPPTLEEI